MSALHNCPDCGSPCDCNGADTPTWFCDHCLVVDEPTYAQRLGWNGPEPRKGRCRLCFVPIKKSERICEVCKDRVRLERPGGDA